MKYTWLVSLLLIGLHTIGQVAVNELNPLPAEGRDDAVAAVVDNVLYTGTGLTSGFYVTNDWWKYNYSNNTWQQLPNIPFEPRQYSKSFTYHQYIYLFGGYQNEANTYNDLWRYDTKTEVWEQLDSLPGNRRWGSFVFKIGEFAYVGGGKDTIQYLQDFYKYHIPSNTWQRINNLPFGARGHGISASNNAYAILGLGANDTNTTHKDLWKFDGITQAFTKLTDLDSSLWRASAASVLDATGESTFLIWGGEFANKQYNASLYSLNLPSINLLTKVNLAQTPANRGCTMVSYLNGAALLFGVNTSINRESSAYYLSLSNFKPVSSKVTAYPNPSASGYFVIEATKPIADVAVYNINGMVVANISFNENHRTEIVNLSELDKGLFLVKVTLQNGTQKCLKLMNKF